MSDEGKRPPAHDAEALDDYVDRLERSLRINMDAYNRALRKARDKRRKRKVALNAPAEDEQHWPDEPLMHPPPKRVQKLRVHLKPADEERPKEDRA